MNTLKQILAALTVAAIAWCAATAGTFIATVQAGREEMRTKDYAGALAQFNAAAVLPEATAAERATARLEMVDAYQALKCPAAAKAELMRLLNLPDIPDEMRVKARARLMRCFYYEGSFEEAETCAQQLLDLKSAPAPQLKDAEQFLAQIRVRREQTAAAVKKAANQTAAATGDWKTWMDEGRNRFNATNYAGAKAAYAEAATKADSWNQKADALLGRARVLTAEGDRAGARSEYDKALAMPGLDGRHSGSARMEIAAILTGDKKPEEALAEYRRVVAIGDLPVNMRADALLAIGKILSAAGQQREAREELVKIFSLAGAFNWQRTDAQRKILQTYAETDDFDGMKKEVERIVADGNESWGQKTDALFFLGAAARKKKEFAAAREAFGRAAALPEAAPDRKAEGLIHAAWAHLDEKNIAEARRTFAKVPEMKDVSVNHKARALDGLGRTWTMEKNWPAARAEYEKILALPATANDIAQARLNLAAVLRAEGNAAGAVEECRKVAADPAVPALLRQQAEQALRKAAEGK